MCEVSDFWRAMLVISAAYAVMGCPSVCVAVSRSWILSELVIVLFVKCFFHRRLATPF